MMIDSIDDPRVQPFRQVRDRDLMRTDGLFIGEGPLTVDKMLSIPGLTRSVLVAERWAERYQSAEANGVEVLVAPKQVMSQIVGFNFHRGVIATGERKAYENRPYPELIPMVDKPATLLVVDGVTNVDNIGLLFRNAAAFACDAVILSKGCCDPLYRKALRVSLGHVLSTPWCVVDDLQVAKTWLTSAKVTVVAAALNEDSVSLSDFKTPSRVALIVGQERHGISPELLEQVDHTVKIPMAAGVDSLNVAAASAVCLHHLSQGQRF
ncbi:MAG: tRNA G18 (ribose-2'-O)-methylase SpoU [Planctomycetota bacterium]|jgi:tRNA G18 (ribose-2'-O)-methylase SpoU